MSGVFCYCRAPLSVSYNDRMAQAQLKQVLSTPILTLYGLGNILGAGIYVLVGKVAGEAGINAPLSFLVAMVIAALTAFSYMELSSRFPKSAGSALYTFQAFRNQKLSLIVGFSMILAGISSAAALSQGFAGYLGQILSVDPVIASVGILLLLTVVALLGIGQSAMVAVAFTVIEALGLLAIIWLGRSYLADVSITQVSSIDPLIGLSGILGGAFLAFYAFIGFEDMVNVAEEAKDARRSMPKAILGSLIAATVIYMLVVLVCIAAATPTELSNTSAPLSLVLDRVSAIDPAVISLIGMVAALNGIIVQLIMGSRLLYGLSKQGWLPEFLARVEPRRQTPITATLIVSGLMILGTLLLPLVSLAQVTSYLALSIFFLVNVSLVVVKRRRESDTDALKVPIVLPVLGAVSALAMLVYQILQAL